MVEGRGRALSPTPGPPLGVPSPQEEGFSSQSAAVDSANLGKPFMQNDMREG